MPKQTACAPAAEGVMRGVGGCAKALGKKEEGMTGSLNLSTRENPKAGPEHVWRPRRAVSASYTGLPSAAEAWTVYGLF